MAFVPAHGAHYYLVAVHSGKVLEVKDAAKNNGAVIQQGDPLDYEKSFHQQFAFLLNGERVYVLQARNSGLVIDVEAASKDDAAKVHQWGWHGVDHERFRVVDAGDGTFFLEAQHSGKVIEIYGEEKKAGAPAKQYHNHANGRNTHQRFRPVLADEGFKPDLLPTFTNPSQIMRDAALGIAGLIPEVGGAVKGLVAFLWPDGGPAMIWNQVLRYIEAYVESKLVEARINSLRETITGAQTNLREFNKLKPGQEKANKLNTTIAILNQVDQPFFNPSSAERTLSYLVTIGTIKLTLLQEQARNYAPIAGAAVDENREVHFESLRAGIAQYTKAAQLFRERALQARVDRIGGEFQVLTVSNRHGEWIFDIILHDAFDGSDMNIRIGPKEQAHLVSSREAAKARLHKIRSDLVRAQFGAQLDAILAPSRLWRSFDPDQARPKKKTVRASVGPYGNAHDPVDLAGGRGIGKIEIWADDSVRGIRVTNRSGVAKLAGAMKGTLQEITLAADEYVSGIYGSAFYYLRSLFLETTYGRRLGAGKLGFGYRFQADLPPEIRARLADIGASGGPDFVDSVQFHWDYEMEGDYPPPSGTALEASLWAPEPSTDDADSKSALPRVVRPAPTVAPATSKRGAAPKISKRKPAKATKKAPAPRKTKGNRKPARPATAKRTARRG